MLSVITIFKDSGISPECQTDWIQIRSDVSLGLIWVQFICKGFEQTALVLDKELSRMDTPGLITEQDHFCFQGCCPWVIFLCHILRRSIIFEECQLSSGFGCCRFLLLFFHHLLLLPLFVGGLYWFLVSYAMLRVLSSLAIILMRSRELVALLQLSTDVLWLIVFWGSSSWCRWLGCSVWLWYFQVILTYVLIKI